MVGNPTRAEEIAMRHIATFPLAVAACLFVAVASAKLPPPGDEAKAKAAEAAAKTAHGDKVAAYKLCTSMNKVAVDYFSNARKAGKRPSPAVATPPCADPGPFVYKPAAPAVSAPVAAKK
jgi:hypothetical protein